MGNVLNTAFPQTSNDNEFRSIDDNSILVSKPKERTSQIRTNRYHQDTQEEDLDSTNLSFFTHRLSSNKLYHSPSSHLVLPHHPTRFRGKMALSKQILERNLPVNKERWFRPQLHSFHSASLGLQPSYAECPAKPRRHRPIQTVVINLRNPGSCWPGRPSGRL